MVVIQAGRHQIFIRMVEKVQLCERVGFIDLFGAHEGFFYDEVVLELEIATGKGLTSQFNVGLVGKVLVRRRS